MSNVNPPVNEPAPEIHAELDKMIAAWNAGRNLTPGEAAPFARAVVADLLACLERRKSLTTEPTPTDLEAEKAGQSTTTSEAGTFVRACMQSLERIEKQRAVATDPQPAPATEPPTSDLRTDLDQLIKRWMKSWASTPENAEARALRACLSGLRDCLDRHPVASPDPQPDSHRVAHADLYEQLGNNVAAWLQQSGHGDSATGPQMVLRVCAQSIAKLIADYPPTPSVPLSELQSLIDSLKLSQVELVSREWCCGLIAALITKHSPQQPNPHPPGTYLWAREEHARGRTVRRGDDQFRSTYTATFDWDAALWAHADLVATNWEVVP